MAKSGGGVDCHPVRAAFADTVSAVTRIADAESGHEFRVTVPLHHLIKTKASRFEQVSVKCSQRAVVEELELAGRFANETIRTLAQVNVKPEIVSVQRNCIVVSKDRIYRRRPSILDNRLFAQIETDCIMESSKTTFSQGDASVCCHRVVCGRHTQRQQHQLHQQVLHRHCRIVEPLDIFPNSIQ